jgi:hypothetical protein
VTLADTAKPLRFSVDSITVGDMEDIEEIAGKSFAEIVELLKAPTTEGGMINVPIKVLKAVVFVIYRQGNPDFTLDDARKVKVTELELVMSEPDPTEPPG